MRNFSKVEGVVEHAEYSRLAVHFVVGGTRFRMRNHPLMPVAVGHEVSVVGLAGPHGEVDAYALDNKTAGMSSDVLRPRHAIPMVMIVLAGIFIGVIFLPGLLIVSGGNVFILGMMGVPLVGIVLMVWWMRSSTTKFQRLHDEAHWVLRQ